MNRNILFLCIVLFFASCGTERHVPQHGAMNKSGEKSHKNAQQKLSSRFGGPNFNRPNRFKKRHFKKGFTFLLREFEDPIHHPMACIYSMP